MASNLDFLVAFLLGILPGIWILWTSLHRFDRPYVDRTLFDDRRVFGSLAVGLVFGTVASVFALSIPRVDIVGILVAVSASFLFEESFKLVWLNRRAYQGRFDTTFYGVPLGTGIAASGVVAAAWASRESLYVPETFILLVIYSIGLGLINADTGALIGLSFPGGNVAILPARHWRPIRIRRVPLPVHPPGHPGCLRGPLRGHCGRIRAHHLLLRLQSDPPRDAARRDPPRVAPGTPPSSLA